VALETGAIEVVAIEAPVTGGPAATEAAIGGPMDRPKSTSTS
jgi:hypothetical protein